MENKIFKIVCPLCGGNTRLWGKKNNYNLFSCLSCKLIFVNPSPDPESIYSEDYFSGAKKGFGYVDYDKDKKPMVGVFNKYLDLFSKYGKTGGRLFDVGAATGFFLDLARKRGYEVSGVEMSEHATEIAKGKGIDVSSGDMISLKLAPDSYDIVTMLDVLEHMVDPFRELLEAKKVLKSGGLLVVNSPNGQSLLSRILKSKWHLVLPPEHLFYFSPRNLTKFMEENGFTVLYTGTIGKRFTLEYVFIMLYKWQKLSIWNYLSRFFSKGYLSRLYIPINLHDNFFMIFRKHEK